MCWFSTSDSPVFLRGSQFHAMLARPTATSHIPVGTRLGQQVQQPSKHLLLVLLLFWID